MVAHKRGRPHSAAGYGGVLATPNGVENAWTEHLRDTAVNQSLVSFAALHQLAIVAGTNATITPTLDALMRVDYIGDDGTPGCSENGAIGAVLSFLRTRGVDKSIFSTRALPGWPREMLVPLDSRNPNDQAAAQLVMISLFGRKWRQARAQWAQGRCAKTGRAYWWHRTTRHTMWERPDPTGLIAEGFDPHVYALLKEFIPR